MELICKLIELALIECNKHGTVDLPLEGMPSTLIGECTLQFNQWNTDVFLTLFGVFTIIEARTMTMWHSSKLEVPAWNR